jgi:hypothetical protein
MELAMLVVLANSALLFSGVLLGSVLAWAGLFGVIARDCSEKVTSWILFQMAATAFLPGDASALPCIGGWRLLCAASFWFVLSMLIAPAAGDMHERQAKLAAALTEKRPLIRRLAIYLRKGERDLANLADDVSKRVRKGAQSPR